MFKGIKKVRKTREVLEAIRDIIINELDKNYYKSPKNIDKIIELDKERKKTIENDYALIDEYYNEFMIIYKNEFVMFENRVTTITNIKYPEEKLSNKSMIKKQYI